MVRALLIALLVVVAPLLTGCDGGGISNAQYLTRASLDARGRRPTVDELNAADVDATVAGFVDDDEFAGRAADVYAEAFRTRVDSTPFSFENLGIAEEDDARFQQAVADEVPNLVRYIAQHDLPFTTLLSSEHTFVDPILLQTWPLEEVVDDALPEAPAGTVRARYTDGRPTAGVLGMNAVWWRHPSTFENAQRGRTNALSQALLCKSYLDRPVDFPQDLDLTDTESIHTAIQTNQACQACHATLDPAASHLWGFHYVVEDAATWATYHPENELAWRGSSEASPAWFGVPTGGGVDDLAGAIAADDRFVSCAVERATKAMLGRDLTVDDDGLLAEHREVFLQSSLSLKALWRSLLADPRYRGREVTPRFGGKPAPITAKMATPAQLSSSMLALTGHALTFEGRDAFQLDRGLRGVAGGSDKGSATTPSTGMMLVLRRAAEAGAAHVVAGEDDTGVVGAALDGVSFDDAPTRQTAQTLLAITASRVVAEDSADVDAVIGLWNELRAVVSAREAWKGLLTALLADPAAVVL